MNRFCPSSLSILLETAETSSWQNRPGLPFVDALGTAGNPSTRRITGGLHLLRRCLTGRTPSPVTRPTTGDLVSMAGVTNSDFRVFRIDCEVLVE